MKKKLLATLLMAVMFVMAVVPAAFAADVAQAEVKLGALDVYTATQAKSMIGDDYKTFWGSAFIAEFTITNPQAGDPTLFVAAGALTKNFFGNNSVSQLDNLIGIPRVVYNRKVDGKIVGGYIYLPRAFIAGDMGYYSQYNLELDSEFRFVASLQYDVAKDVLDALAIVNGLDDWYDIWNPKAATADSVIKLLNNINLNVVQRVYKVDEKFMSVFMEFIKTVQSVNIEKVVPGWNHGFYQGTLEMPFTSNPNWRWASDVNYWNYPSVIHNNNAGRALGYTIESKKGAFDKGGAPVNETGIYFLGGFGITANEVIYGDVWTITLWYKDMNPPFGGSFSVKSVRTLEITAEVYAILTNTTIPAVSANISVLTTQQAKDLGFVPKLEVIEGGVMNFVFDITDKYWGFANRAYTFTLASKGYSSTDVSGFKLSGLKGDLTYKLDSAANWVPQQEVITLIYDDAFKGMTNAKTPSYGAQSLKWEGNNAANTIKEGAELVATLTLKDTFGNDINYSFEFTLSKADIEALTSGTLTSLLGDVDGNGAVNLVDAQLVLKSIVGLVNLTDAQKAAALATVSGSTAVSTVHAAQILKIIVGLA